MKLNNVNIANEIACQLCGNTSLEKVMDLGMQPLCNEFFPLDKLNHSQVYYPLELYHCENDGLVQLGYTMPTTQVFGDQYTYLTGSSKTLVDFYNKWAKILVEKLELKPGDTVVEIACNDGTFLEAFQSLGLNVIGIDGASQAVNVAHKKGLNVIQDFFSKGLANEVRNRVPKGSKIRLICGFSVLAHTDGFGDFLAEINSLMTEETTFVSQSHWLRDLVQENEFDTIYHEHLRYFTLASLRAAHSRFGMNLYDATVTEFYGGCIFAYASLDQSLKLSDEAKEILAEEEKLNMVESLKKLNLKLPKRRIEILSFLTELRKDGSKIVGIGAPMKCATFLNYLGIGPELIDYLLEMNPLKVDTAVPGVRIPVFDECLLFEEQPEYAFLFSWNMAKDIIPKLKKKGYKGKFITAIPELKIIE